MSFGGPGGSGKIYTPSPPERGSFPLDHYGECTSTMTAYMKCLKQHSVHKERVPNECRLLAQDYLNCRMDKGLMVRDEWQNLGLPGYKSNPS
ncbi:uncharacterized protein V1516DRAFT_669529 [Lipomyces oligophaga]|uniref:uncharacterized protein n=1 Tax=Lipomyces oligophaga TaxID=45792 RepID=UPI0034D01C4E